MATEADQVLRFETLGGTCGVAPYPAVVLPDGTHTPLDDARKPCGVCGGTTFEVIRRWVTFSADKKAGPDAEPRVAESYAIICPRCMPIDSWGKNLFGKVERRELLGHYEATTGAFTPVDRGEEQP